MTKRVLTFNVNPPIPTTRYDWCAYREGEEERGNYGWGATEQQAALALFRIEDGERATP